jgi:hypothetical protein
VGPRAAATAQASAPQGDVLEPQNRQGEFHGHITKQEKRQPGGVMDLPAASRVFDAGNPHNLFYCGIAIAPGR